MLAYLRSLVTRYMLIILKTTTTGALKTNDSCDSQFRRLELAYATLVHCESLVKSAYSLVNAHGTPSCSFLFLCNEAIRTQKSQLVDENLRTVTFGEQSGGGGVESLVAIVAEASATKTPAVTKPVKDSVDDKEQPVVVRDGLLVRRKRIETIQFGDLIFENVKKKH